jgi:tRNA threonylcarbamoyladenosine biosynthesis protein TsaE
MKYEIITRSAEETIRLGEKIGRLLKSGDVVAYKGGLGMGKTTITRGISLGMGLGDEVTSPTFALVNEYRGNALSLYHFDMYRITSAADLETTGFYDYLEDGGVLAVEWSENIAEELPDGTIYIEISRADESYESDGSDSSDNARKITVIGDERFENIGN